MKKTLLILALATTFVSCNQKSAADKLDPVNLENAAASAGAPKVVVDNATHDFGDLKLHDKAEHTFVIKNEGDADLLILDARPSCGCTVPDNFTKTPIKPGESGIVPVVYNATDAGVQQKTVTLTTNSATGSEVLTIKANVKP